jgi:uncharacterized protein YoxC
MTLIDVFVIVLILTAFSLSIFVIVFLKRIYMQAVTVQKDIHRLVENTIPVMSNLKEVTERANRIVTGVEGYYNEADCLIKNVRERISILTSNRRFRSVERPVKYIVNNIRALASGTSAFLNSYKHK